MHNNHEQLAAAKKTLTTNSLRNDQSAPRLSTLSADRFQVWLGDNIPPPLYKNQVRRNWVFQGGTLSGGTDDEERLSDPGWDREKQRRRAGYVEPQALGKL